MNHCFKYQPKERLTILELLQHPFIKEHSKLKFKCLDLSGETISSFFNSNYGDSIFNTFTQKNFSNRSHDQVHRSGFVLGRDKIKQISKTLKIKKVWFEGVIDQKQHLSLDFNNRENIISSKPFIRGISNIQANKKEDQGIEQKKNKLNSFGNLPPIFNKKGQNKANDPDKDIRKKLPLRLKKEESESESNENQLELFKEATLEKPKEKMRKYIPKPSLIIKKVNLVLNISHPI